MEERVTGDELIGVATERAADLVGASVPQLAAWERSGLVRPEASAGGARRRLRLYGLDELVELCVVRTLLERDIDVAVIRRLVEAQRSFNVEAPLRELRWATDDRRVYVQEHNGRWVGGEAPAQGVMVEVIDLDVIRATMRRKATERPGEWAGQVERRDRVQGKKLVFKGTRTPVAAVQEYLRRGLTDERILDAFPHLKPDDIREAERQLQATA